LGKYSGLPLTWTDSPDDNDYKDCYDFLCGMYADDGQARAMLTALKAAPVRKMAAKNLIRANGTRYEGKKARKQRLKQIKSGQPLNPILVVRGDPQTGRRLLIADGFSRTHAALKTDPEATVMAKMA
jgi:hypothetical protein